MPHNWRWIPCLRHCVNWSFSPAPCPRLIIPAESPACNRALPSFWMRLGSFTGWWLVQDIARTLCLALRMVRALSFPIRGARFLGLATKTLRDIYTDIAIIAGTVGAAERGDQVIAGMESYIGEVRLR